MDLVIWLVVATVVIIQIIMIVKFFEIASDINDVRNILAKAIQHKSTNIQNAEQTKNQSTEIVEKKGKSSQSLLE